MVVNDNIKKEIQSFYHRISDKIKIDSIYLFGSYARGNSNADSDVDIAVLSEEFEGIRFFDRLKMSKIIIRETYPDLDFVNFEIHPYKTEEFTEADPFVAEILRTGIRII